jgi:hypothetical protein
MGQEMSENGKLERFGGNRWRRKTENKRTITVLVDDEIYNGLQKLAYLEGRTLSDKVRRAWRAEVAAQLDEGTIGPGPLTIKVPGIEALDALIAKDDPR